MPTFYNRATLSYNGITRDSNITTGELLDVLSITKNSTKMNYNIGDELTYVVNLRNTGTAPLNAVTLTDNLGAYPVGANTVYPLEFNSILFYVDGVLQPTPAITAGPPLTVSGINIPAGSTATLVYDTGLTEFAPLNVNGTINNAVTATGAGVTTPATASETVTVDNVPNLVINKALNPLTVTPGSQVTYTFRIQNFGNTEAAAGDNVAVSDTFTPAITNIQVSLNGTALTTPADYTYNEATGQFDTVPGRITVPAATYVQDPNTGAITTTPGEAVLTVTGTI